MSTNKLFIRIINACKGTCIALPSTVFKIHVFYHAIAHFLLFKKQKIPKRLTLNFDDLKVLNIVECIRK